MEIRFRFKIMGAHVHVRTFTGPDGRGALAGTLVFDLEHWPVARACLENAGAVIADDATTAATAEPLSSPPTAPKPREPMPSDTCSCGRVLSACESYWTPGAAHVDADLPF